MTPARTLRAAAGLALALAALEITSGVVEAREVPFLSGRVVDEAGLLPPERRTAIETSLAALEKETGAQVAVLTVRSLDGVPIEDFSIRVVETWKLGRGAQDDGVLFLVAKDDRKMRIEVGYGLEPTLTDIKSRRILDEVVRPAFQAGDFATGIANGVEAIATVVRKGDLPPPESLPQPAAPLGAKVAVVGIVGVAAAIFGGIGLFAPGCAFLLVYAVLTPFVFAAASVVLPAAAVGPVMIVWLLLLPLLRLVLWLTGKLPKGQGWGWGTVGGRKGKRSWTFGGGSGWSSSSSSGGYSSGDSFSGGGGSFGGGGSSSSW